MKIYGIIPARYGSTRFPGKPLVDIRGKPMIQHVVEQCTKAQHLEKVIVATDDERIRQTVNEFGGTAVLTDKGHTNGTERCAEAALKITEEIDYIVNIQGDEPLISPRQLDNFCNLLITKKPPIATMIRPLTEENEINSPHVVKCVVTTEGKALYFSRSPIPYDQQSAGNARHFQHIGLYAFQYSVLKKIVQLSPSPLEKTERLEQLRWLENGYNIFTTKTNEPTFAVDTPEDVKKILKQLEQ